MNNLTFSYYEVEKNLELLDKKGNHILIADGDETYSVSKLKILIDSIKQAEISLYINLNSYLPQDFIDFCISHRLILYFDLISDCNMDHLQQLSKLDLVAILPEDNVETLADQTINIIIDHNVNLCVLVKDGEFQRIASLYERFLNQGFTRIFNITYEPRKVEYNAEQINLINRCMIEQFNFNQNISIRSQIENLKRNVFKRHNRMLNIKNVSKTNIYFVNVNVNLHMHLERKNLGIEYLASVLNSRGYNADCLYSDKLTLLSKIEVLIEENDVKVIGFSCMQDNIYVVKNAIKYLKSKYADIVFLVGGAQAVALGEMFIQESGVDYIMVGESEYCITDLMDYIFYQKGSIEDINNICYINHNGDYIENAQGELICDLDAIPFPNYVLKNDDSLTYAGILTGRGCPFKCAFCYQGVKEKTVRYRSLDNVFEEISLLLKNNKNVKAIQFYDDTFTLDAKRVREFCKRFSKIHEEFGISWICEIHCQTVYDKPELMKLMVEAGLNEAQIGIESGDDGILKKLNKSITSDMIIQTIENCRKAGLYMLEGNIMLGAAGETKEQLEANLDYVERLILAGKGMLQIYPVMLWPFPHTPITIDPAKYGVKIIEEQCDYTINCISNCVSESDSVPRQEFVDHFYRLSERISEIYIEIASQLNAKEARKHWLNGSFSFVEQWGRSLSAYKYMNTFFIAKDKNDVDLSNDEVYPIRSFDVLSYEKDQLYLRETKLLIDPLDSRILEISNGKNNVKEIANRLGVDIKVVHERLNALEDKMLVYGATI